MSIICSAAKLEDQLHHEQLDLVSNATLEHFWLNEGFTVYAERRILEALEGAEAAELHAAVGLHDLEIASHPGTAEVDFREYPPRLEPGMVMQLTISLPFDENWTD